ncbi:XTP/dITP diphosphatase [Litchfieldia alkalitelluris]|uniref:XTP/dITP diphosphatase n=1 Tax=Litchfieldia alkalitelluris TaxID=304268 RepID=UPI000996678A|nr:XTP/dITP diphosphatase [Litchfieldia alkalitelluris]
MKDLIIATKNKGKVRDFKELFSSKGFTVKSLLDFPELADVDETGKTFIENAALKAEQISKELDCIVIADDSGLSIDALNGDPGVYSARYAGEHKSDADNIKKVLKQLEGVPEDKRNARFHCALALTIPEGETHIVEGTCEGMIAFEQKGEHGFGYDPIFYIPELNKTMAQLTSEEKNKISHRANALKKLEDKIKEIFK